MLQNLSVPKKLILSFMAVIAGGRGSNVGLVIGACSIMALLEGTRFLKDFITVIDGREEIRGVFRVMQRHVLHALG